MCKFVRLKPKDMTKPLKEIFIIISLISTSIYNVHAQVGEPSKADIANMKPKSLHIRLMGPTSKVMSPMYPMQIPNYLSYLSYPSGGAIMNMSR